MDFGEEGLSALRKNPAGCSETDVLALFPGEGLCSKIIGS